MSLYTRISVGGDSISDALITLNDRLVDALPTLPASMEAWQRRAFIDHIYDEVITDRFLGGCIELEGQNDN